MTHLPLKLIVLAVGVVAVLLASAGLNPVRAAFAGANGKIAYVRTSGVDTSGGHIWVMNPDGSGQTDVSGSAAFLDNDPAWSPDASRIAFVSKRGSYYNVWVMNADGSGQTNLTQQRTVEAEDPTWSPDGTKIAFTSRTAGLGNSEIFTMNADGSNLVQLTNTPVNDPGGFESNPTWSPDGTRLAFEEGYACGGARGIFVMNVDGSNRTEVSENLFTDCITHPTWSPDGVNVAFIGGGELYVVNAGGNTPAKVPTSVRTFNGVAWSPDGTKLAFSNEQGNSNISVIGIDGSGEHELASNVEEERTLDWAPVDTTPPNTAITAGPADGSTTTDATPSFEFSSNEGGTFECSLDGGSFTPCRSPQTTPPLANGRHTFAVRPIDAAGNADPSPASRSFTVDVALPRPTLGVTANVGVVKGEVLVAVPAASASGAGASQKGLEFVPLTQARQIPIGSFLDTRRGTARLAVASGATGGSQSGEFGAGLFQVLQSRKKKQKGLTELRLKGSTASLKRCRSAASRAAGLSRRTVRRLRAKGTGNFRTRGLHSAATVRGTVWVTADRCDGTLTTVRRGKVAVRDFRLKKTVLVKRGKSYLARAPGS